MGEGERGEGERGKHVSWDFVSDTVSSPKRTLRRQLLTYGKVHVFLMSSMSPECPRRRRHCLMPYLWFKKSVL
jgi:hypothetical protein